MCNAWNSEMAELKLAENNASWAHWRCIISRHTDCINLAAARYDGYVYMYVCMSLYNKIQQLRVQLAPLHPTQSSPAQLGL